MKRQATLWIILFVLVFLASAYIASQKPKFRMDRCTTQIILLKGGYRSWGVNYCYGFDFREDGSERHFYHKPIFFHADIRKLISPDLFILEGQKK